MCDCSMRHDEYGMECGCICHGSSPGRQQQAWQNALQLRAQLATALSAIDEALALHKKQRPSENAPWYCWSCGALHPCPTVSALLKAKGEG